jgi:heparanase 1
VLLNDSELKPTTDGDIPVIKGQPVKQGALRFAPQTITYITFPNARNTSCM